MDVMFLIEKYGKLRNLSPRTIDSYKVCLTKFFRRHWRKDPRQITKQDVENYMYEMIKRNKAPKTINVYLSALKFFFDVVLKKKLLVKVPALKTENKLPVFLTKEESEQLFEAIVNDKHKLMILLLYSAGLRVSELVNIKVRDFEFAHQYGWVRQGKGRKDRLFVVAKKINQELQEWVKLHDLTDDDWLFPSSRGGHLTVRSVQSILRTAAKKAKIKKKVSPHTLRHTFATHLIENGYAVTDVQPLLGHNRLDTTMTYVHMATNRMIRVESPLDSLGKKEAQSTMK